MITHPNEAGEGTSYNSDNFRDRFYDDHGYLPPEPQEPHYMDEW